MNPRAPSRARLATIMILAFSLTACGPDGNGSTADDEPVAGSEVTVTDNEFEPQILQVETDQPVTWTWDGDNPHDVAFDDVASEIQRSGTYTHTFEEAGELEYVCTVHNGMTGTVVVVAP